MMMNMSESSKDNPGNNLCKPHMRVFIKTENSWFRHHGPQRMCSAVPTFIVVTK